MTAEPHQFGDALHYSERDWLRFGDVANPTTKQKMILLAIEQIVRVGPADFTAGQVCDRLNIKQPMINHHFGSRDAFMAEVHWWAYQQWARHVDATFRAAPANPRKRLQAFVEGEVEWAKRMGGMHILVHYPMVSAKSLAILAEAHQAEMQQTFEYHLALITVCVRDMQKGTVSEFDFDRDSVPKRKLLTPLKYFLTATQISWATHGLATWSSGQHVATQRIEAPGLSKLTTQFAVSQMVKTIVDLASGD